MKYLKWRQLLNCDVDTILFKFSPTAGLHNQCFCNIAQWLLSCENGRVIKAIRPPPFPPPAIQGLLFLYCTGFFLCFICTFFPFTFSAFFSIHLPACVQFKVRVSLFCLLNYLYFIMKYKFFFPLELSFIYYLQLF